MEPSSFPEENLILDKPPGMSYDDCMALSVFQGEDSVGQPVVISCWKPTKKELEEINRTGRVWLWIYGQTMPPAAVGGFNPFEKRDEEQNA